MPDNVKDFLFEYAYWVEENKLMAGPHPLYGIAYDDDIVAAALHDIGVRTIINLTENEYALVFPDNFRETPENKISLLHFPIKDMGVPDRVTMCRILDAIDESIRNNKPVYVHCMAGIGRTGTVVGCYLIRRGLANDADVFKVISKKRRMTVHSLYESPETWVQKEFVSSWVEDE